jgi:hypothetical protein
MKTKQQLMRIIDQRDRDLDDQGGLVGVARRLISEIGARGMIASEIADRLFPELSEDERYAISEILEEEWNRPLPNAQ